MKTVKAHNRKFLTTMARPLLMGLVAITSRPIPVDAQTTYFVRDAAEICSTLQSVGAGDTLVMLNDGNWIDQDITFETRQGTFEQPITLRAETPGQVILKGQSRLRLGGEHLIVDGLYFTEGMSPQFGTNVAVVEFRTEREPGNPCRQNSWLAHHSRLTNSAFENYNPPNTINEYKWVALYGSHNRVDHSTFKAKSNKGSLLTVVRGRTGDEQHHTIDHNYFADLQRVDNGGEAIRVGDTTELPLTDSFTIVESNLFERSNGDQEIISIKSGGNKILYNTFLQSEGMVTLRAGNNALLEGNFFFGNNVRGTGGVRVLGKGHRIINNYFSGINSTTDARAALILSNGFDDPQGTQQGRVEDALVAFNTFVNNDRNLIIGGGPGLPPKNSTIANNIVARVQAPGPAPCLIKIIQQPENLTYQRNIVHGGCLDDTPPAEGQIEEIDPRLLPVESGSYLVFRPDGESPAINTALGDYPLVITDMDGQPRDVELKDVGADEASFAPIVRRPLAPREVGPAWWWALQP